MKRSRTAPSKARKKSIGTYTYDKRQPEGVVPVRVRVFLLEVIEELDEWPESAERKRTWFTPERAARAVDEPELARLIRALDPD